MSIQNLHTPAALANGAPPHTNGTSSSDELSPAEQLEQLAQIKAALQARLDGCYAVLEVNHANMLTPLVDAQGFPRSDIDVAGVRTARAEVHRIRNDLTDTTNKMALLLQQALARQEDEPAGPAAPVEAAPERAFVRVDGVFPGGPADLAGLKREDLIIAFGSVTTSSPQTLSALSTLVAASQNVPLAVQITRPPATERITLTLTPTSNWGGRGLLGCHIVPV